MESLLYFNECEESRNFGELRKQLDFICRKYNNCFGKKLEHTGLRMTIACRRPRARNGETDHRRLRQVCSVRWAISL